MENLKAEMQRLSCGETVVKRDFLLTLIVGLIFELPFRTSFIENISKPLKDKEVNEPLSVLIDCIFGYYIYLLNHEPSDESFRRDAIGDLYRFLYENDGGYKTKNFKGYLEN